MSDQLVPMTDKQRAYLFGVVYKEVSLKLGIGVEEIHRRFKDMFLSYHDDLGFRRVYSTKDLSTKNFSTYVECIAEWAASKHNIIIPEAEGIDYAEQPGWLKEKENESNDTSI